MNFIKKWIRNFFGFSGREINGFLILLPLMILIISSEPLYRMWMVHRDPEFASDRKILDSLVSLWNTNPIKDSISPIVEKNPIARDLFAFDPNKVTLKELESLGFSKNLATRITNYRQKGGEFRVKDDLKKIYGVDTPLYNRIHTYITLPDKLEKNTTHRDSIKVKRNDLLISFDLNKADTAQLKSVYGIGPALALRILKFREGLGGFVSQAQLKEVFGLDSSVVERIVKVSFIASDFVPRKIDMNTASEKELASHPYIKKNIANAIVAYRFQHGNYKDIEEIRNLGQIKKSDVEKIIPYLIVNH